MRATPTCTSWRHPGHHPGSSPNCPPPSGRRGVGRVGTNLATTGHHVTLGLRNPEKETATPAEGTGPRISFADQRTTARTADIVT
ncbi:hypothetical protein [Streptomyces morookaense]|uniref:hypothetical protein n=1 Tax=Streptomyces morookaense TaxID=1970 RepID=UPI001E54E15F|nr:hypothetical protein [Streptomyces morookaense]